MMIDVREKGLRDTKKLLLTQAIYSAEKTSEATQVVRVCLVL